MKNPKHNRIFAVVCWLGAALCAFLAFWLFYMANKYPEMEAFTGIRWLVIALTLLWLAAAVWFTAIARSGKQDRKK